MNNRASHALHLDFRSQPKQHQYSSQNDEIKQMYTGFLNNHATYFWNYKSIISLIFLLVAVLNGAF